MGKINKVGEKLKRGKLFLFILFVAIASKGFCAMDDSNNNTHQKTIESSNKQEFSKKTLEKDKIDLGVTEANQIKAYNSLDNKIIGLEKQIRQTKEEIDKKFDYQIQCNEKAINSVNASISGASYALTIIGIAVSVIGIIIGLLAIGLGIYITIQARNVTHIAKQSKTIRDNHLKIRDEVRDLDENIKNNMSKLYGDLKREETVALVERLTEVPEDIGNLFESLASREIPKELFPQMKKAYQSFSNDDHEVRNYKGAYLTLFFQHFPSLTLFDEDLQNDIENRYVSLMDASFKNDITKTSEDFIKVTIKEGDILHFSEKIKKYFIALQQSKFKKYSELHKHIYEILLTKENRFNLYSILQQEVKDTAKIYGQFLLTDYKDTSNTGAENKILTDITKAIETKKEDSKPEPSK